MSEMLINQLSHRLETATTVNERIDTLSELKTLCRTDPASVAKLTLQKIIELLKEQGDADEYMEALEVITKLLKCKDSSVASNNAALILSTAGNVELFLDLLEHDDPLIGVMSSEILTLLHKRSPSQLEAAVQACPEGMNKLLNRLPDHSREEVRNQAIILVQQLTQSNEEMKKTVAFNEGFEIVFSIINVEGGPSEVTAVTLDCLSILRNILSGSETCQRLFYGMGGNYHVKLLDFFDISMLPSAWFEDNHRFSGAELSVQALTNSITPAPSAATTPVKHQDALCDDVVPAIVQILLLHGPAEIVQHGLVLLQRVLANNSSTSARFFDHMFSFTTPEPSSYPTDIELPSNKYSWKPYAGSDQRFISLPALLAEKYIHHTQCWSTEEFSTVSTNDDGSMYLAVLNELLQSEGTCGVLAMQHVLAPPPPPLDMEDSSAQPQHSVAHHILKSLVSICSQLLTYTASTHASIPAQLQVEAEKHLVRCVNCLVLMLMHGGQVARELFTAMSTSHVAQDTPSQPLLLFLLSVCSKCMRLPSIGVTVTVALLRLVACAASGCPRAVQVILDDPANLFVVDLASVASENAGVPLEVQRAACLFLGCCFHTLSSATSANAEHISSDAILRMIDSKIGLTRFNNILRQPVNKQHPIQNSKHFINAYSDYYEDEVSQIRQTIFDMYTGTDGPSNSRESQIIQMQKEHIARLEKMLHNTTAPTVEINDNNAPSPEVEALHKAHDELLDMHEDLVRKYDAQELEIQRLQTLLESAPSKSLPSEHMGNGDVTLQLSRAEATITDLRNTLQEQQNLHKAAEEAAQQEILDLKSKVLQLRESTAALETEVSEKNRKLHILEDNLRSPLPFEKMNTERLSQLENRNAELKQRVWELEAEVVRLKGSVIAAEKSYGELIYSIGELNRQFTFTTDGTPVVSADESPVEAIAAKLSDVAAKCSDMAEGAGCGFETDESQPLQRILECATFLSDIVYESKDCLSENAMLRDQLKATEEQLCAIEGDHADLVSAHDALEIDAEQYKRDIEHLNASISALQSEKKQAEQCVDELTHQLQLLQEQAAASATSEDWQSKINALRDEYDERAVDLHTQLCDANDIVIRLQQEKQTMELQLASRGEHDTALAEKEREIDDLKHHLEKLEMNLADAQQQQAALNDNFTHTKAELNSKQQIIDETTMSVVRLEKELEHAKRQCDQYASNVAALQETLDSERMAWQQQQTHSTISSQEMEQLQLRDAVQQLHNANGELEIQLRSAQHQYHSVMDECENMRNELQAKQQAIDELTSSLQVAESSVLSKDQTIKELQLEIAQRIENIDAASNTNNTALQQMTSELSGLRSQMVSYEEKINRLNELLQEREDEKAQLIQQHQESVDAQQSTIRQLQQEIDVLQQQHDSSESEIIASLQQSVTHLESDCQLKATTITTLQQRLSENDTQLDVAQGEVDELQNRLYTLLQEHEKTKQELHRMQQSVESAAEEVKGKESWIADLRQQLESSHTTIATLERSIVDLQASANNSNSEQVQLLQHQLEEARKCQAKLQQQVSDVTADAETKVADLQADISHLSQELANTKTSYTNLLGSYNELNVELAEATTASSTVAEYQRTQQQLQEDIGSLQSQLQRQTAEAKEAAQRLNEYQQTATASYAELQQQVQHLQQTKQEKEQEIMDLNRQVSQKSEEYSALLEKYIHEKELRDSEIALQNDKSYENIAFERDSYRTETTNLQLELRQKEEKILQLEEKYHALDMEYNLSVEQLKTCNHTILHLEQDVDHLEVKLQEASSTYEFQRRSADSRIEHLEGELKVKLKMVQMLQSRSNAEKNAMMRQIRDRVTLQFNSQVDHLKATFATTLAALNSKLYKCQDELRKLASIVRNDKKTIAALKQNLAGKNKLLQQYELTQQESFDLLRRSISSITTDTSASYYLSPDELNIILSSSSASNYVNSNTSRLITSVTQVSQLVILLLSAYRSQIKENKKMRKESEAKVVSLERSLQVVQVHPSLLLDLFQELKQQQWITPEKSGRYLSATMPGSSNGARMHTEMKRERHRLQELQEQHNDLLGLLAQQEVELGVFKDKIKEVGGKSIYKQCMSEAKRLVETRYGSYVAFRGDDALDALEPSTPPSRQSIAII